ncbi:MAG: nucleotide sugar dehydrogenase [Moraxellaceae bacterium]|nr:nucleotide sugar dehydrogenase [Moraxellaceae bacterium]MCP5177553.1 nucleotide sugar dehydrogenase [Moraxellaceae bacterium]
MHKTVAIVGLGYVGLPLALAFGCKMKTIGFDISQSKLNAYKKGYDPAGEMEVEQFQASKHISYTNQASDLIEADYIIIAVPTPIDNAKQPDLTPVIGATKTIAPFLKKDVIVVYESTVYPGVTEDICSPLLEAESGKKRTIDFKLGYSPERIVPGDKVRRLETITKIVSAEDEDSLAQVAALYSLVIDAGVYCASSIRVAEAAKVIENTQRDVNIALMNELAVIFNLMDIDTIEVLEAAGTKWNFLPFRPGLVGGHCIGVDPYYLTHKVSTLGYNPEIILAARRINDRMGSYIAQQTVKLMIKTGRMKLGATVLVLGLTFKENCADIRNTKVIDIISELKEYGLNVLVVDSVAESHEAEEEYGIHLTRLADVKQADAVIAAVAHTDIKAMDIRQLIKVTGLNTPFMDVKSIFNRENLEYMGFVVWRL